MAESFAAAAFADPSAPPGRCDPFAVCGMARINAPPRSRLSFFSYGGFSLALDICHYERLASPDGLRRTDAYARNRSHANGDLGDDAWPLSSTFLDRTYSQHAGRCLS